MLILFSPYLYLLKLLTLLFPIWGYLQRNYSYLLEGSTAESRKVLVISTVVEEHVWYQVVFSRWSSSKRKEIMTAVLVFAQISILCWKYQKLQIAAPPESSTHSRIVLVSQENVSKHSFMCCWPMELWITVKGGESRVKRKLSKHLELADKMEKSTLYYHPNQSYILCFLNFREKAC